MERFIVRMPPGMRDRIRAAAEAAGRSMNAEIVATLEATYPEPDPLSETAARDLLAYILSASTPEETEARKAEVNAKIAALGSTAMVKDVPHHGPMVFLPITPRTS
nr:Arc family DNA-binding protein [Stagnihabitans tardus]